MIIFSQRFLPEKGGSINWIREIIRCWPEKIILFSHKYQGGAGDLKNIKIWYKSKIMQKDWGVRGFIPYCRMFFTLIKILKNNLDRQILCCRLVPEGLIAVILKYFFRDLKVYSLVHGEEVIAYRQSRQLNFLLKFTLKRIDFIIANSVNSANLLPDYVKKEIINPSIDSSKFYPKKKEKEDLIILSVGRLVKRKNFAAVIDLVSKFKSVKYYIIGDGEEKTSLKNQIESLGVKERVVILDKVEDAELSEYYSLSDIFVMPTYLKISEIEGFGIVYLEAQASGLPVIAGCSGGEAEAFREGVTGYRVTNNAELEEKLGILIKDSKVRKEFSMNAVEFAKEFDSTIQIKKLYNLINE